jgi:hypothetical protein
MEIYVICYLYHLCMCQVSIRQLSRALIGFAMGITVHIYLKKYLILDCVGAYGFVDSAHSGLNLL